jgi:glycosyltransferase involved in cell wall biosynthesis
MSEKEQRPMKLSVVIPAYNEEAYLEECLQCVLAEVHRNSADGPIEVIVVNNASTDRTAEIAARFDEVRLVCEPEKGLTKARQRGLMEARGAILAYVDADTRMPLGWIREVLQTFESEDIVCVSGPYVYHDVSRGKKALVRLYWLLLAKPMYWVTRYMAVGGNFAARRDALFKIGGFDTTISFFGEDTDIARRLSSVGKVSFKLSLVMYTSARRLDAEGFITTTVRYILNFASQVVLKKPLTTEYRDIR